MSDSPGSGKEEGLDRSGKSSGETVHDEPASFPIVGIGASAGGLTAFSRMLKALPPDTGMAFVLVQHLDPGHDSLLTELLGRDAKMPVAQVEDGMRVEPNHIYVIPPNANMALYHGRLHLLARSPGLNLPVDNFFHSLAQEQGDRAMGVVLSGTGTDGSRGLREIKTENGVTFAQDSQSADYDGMPMAAVSTGVADFVMPPEQIAGMLVKISRHPALGKEATPESSPMAPEEQEDQFVRIFMLLRARTGADFAYYKRSTLQRRIARRMVILKIEKLEDYVNLLEEAPAEADLLFHDILIHVTSFFREPEVFELLKTKVFPSILKHRGPGTALRVWVPGCSTGEEAYSIAIALAECTESMPSRPSMQIFATDLDAKAIERARCGFYSEDDLAGVSEERLMKYFTRMEHRYRVNQYIREMCVFAKHDILQNPPFSHMDLVSFRNVLIYMERVLQKKVIPTLGYALEPWGFLLLGPSEHIDDSSDLFRIVDKKNNLYARNPTARKPLAVTASMNPQGHWGFADTAARSAGKGRPGFDPQTEANNIVLARYAPAGVLVNDQMQIVQFRGETGRFLSPAAGRASFDLLAMAREGLGLEIRTAIDRAKKSGEPVTRDRVKVNLYDRLTELRLQVIPLKSPMNESYYLILFEDAGEEAAPESGVEKSRETPEGKDEEVSVLRRELESTKQYLLSMIQEKEEVNEKLGAANEEVQSSNEELLSINEEMETAKEELQSANEELITLNEELQSRNLDLVQINDDLVNVQNSVGVPMILMTNDLKIRRVTPAAEKYLDISPADVGRTISDIRLFADSPDLKGMAAEVIRSVTPIEKEVRTKNGRRFSLFIRPYKTSDNRIDGAVLTCEDITDLRLSLEMSDIFLEAANILAETHDIDKLLVSLLKVIDKAIPGCRAIVNLIDTEKDEMEAIAAVGSPVFLHKKLKLGDLAPDSGRIHEKKIVLVDYDSFETAGHIRAFLRESNSRMVLYVPMVSRNRVIGAVSADVPGERHEFSDREIELLAGIASPAAVALENARLYVSSEHIATVLQEALLTEPPDLPGIEFDYIYQSATEAARVGGDFYDVFMVDDRHLGIIIGDVAGKGVGAASYAARANITVKAYALEHDRPDLVMAKTNRALTMTRDNTDFVTIFFGILDIDTGAFTYCNGGHPPALIARSTGEIKQLMTASPLVGSFSDAEFTGGEDRLDKGDVLVLYTDGTIEAKRGGELFGLQRLVEIVKKPKLGAQKSPKELTHSIFSDISRFTGGELADDVAILALTLKD